MDRLFADAARQNHVLIVIGLDRVVTPKLLVNEARLYLPDGGVTTYNKRHLLPGAESMFTPGTEDTVLGTSIGRLGVAICKDLDFPSLGRRYGSRKTGLMLVPALDFHVDGWLHGRMAILRGVESGFSVARSANLGTLTLSDDRGRVLAERASDSQPFATVVSSIPVGDEVTLYSRFGDWFAWLTLVVLGLVAFSAVRRNR